MSCITIIEVSVVMQAGTELASRPRSGRCTVWVVDGRVLASYLAVVSVLMLTPGPDMLFVLASGIRGGSRAGFVAAVGVAVGETVHLLAAAAGLAAVFRAAPALYHLVRFAGAAYLLWLGLRTLRARGGDGMAEGRGGAASTRRAFWRGLLTNVLNPKMALFTLALLPQFVDPSRGRVPAQLLLRGAWRRGRQRLGVPRAGRQARCHPLSLRPGGPGQRVSDGRGRARRAGCAAAR